MPALSEGIEQAKQFWASRSGTQKSLLLASSAGSVLLLALFVRMIGTPDYKPLFTGLEAADAQALTAQLDGQGIPHQRSSDGKTISVPADKLDAARLQTASQGNPHSGRMGFELFDKATWGQTEFDEKVAYQRALEGELERTIQTLGDVQSARVHLVMSTNSVFIDRERGAKASVILKLRRNELSRESILAISRLVAGAVDELKPQDVSIIDADSERSFSMGQDSYGGGEGLEANLKQRLLSTLEPVVGSGRIRATVNVDYDQATTDEKDERYDPSVSALLSQQKTEDEAGDGAAPAGIPGTGSNTPSKQAKTSNTSTLGGTQRSISESAVYGVNKVEIHRTVPAGRVQRITTAILVDDAQMKQTVNGKEKTMRIKRSQEELDKIQQLAQAAIGFDAKRGDVVTIQNLSFDAPAGLSELPPPTWTEKAEKTVRNYAAVMRPLALLALFLLAYLFVVRPVQKHALAPAAILQAEQAQLEAGSSSNLLAPQSQDEETRRAAQLKEQTIQLIKQKPANTARAVQAWLREDLS
jgi:flagellar M-ring protein FliF